MQIYPINSSLNYKTFHISILQFRTNKKIDLNLNFKVKLNQIFIVSCIFELIEIFLFRNSPDLLCNQNKNV